MYPLFRQTKIDTYLLWEQAVALEVRHPKNTTEGFESRSLYRRYKGYIDCPPF